MAFQLGVSPSNDPVNAVRGSLRLDNPNYIQRRLITRNVKHTRKEGLWINNQESPRLLNSERKQSSETLITLETRPIPIYSYDGKIDEQTYQCHEYWQIRTIHLKSILPPMKTYLLPK